MFWPKPVQSDTSLPAAHLCDAGGNFGSAGTSILGKVTFVLAKIFPKLTQVSLWCPPKWAHYCIYLKLSLLQQSAGIYLTQLEFSMKFKDWQLNSMTVQAWNEIRKFPGFPWPVQGVQPLTLITLLKTHVHWRKCNDTCQKWHYLTITPRAQMGSESAS